MLRPQWHVLGLHTLNASLAKFGSVEGHDYPPRKDCKSQQHSGKETEVFSSAFVPLPGLWVPSGRRLLMNTEDFSWVA